MANPNKNPTDLEEWKKSKIVASVDILKVGKESYKYIVSNHSNLAEDLLHAVLLGICKQLLTDMLIYNNDPEYVIELVEEMAEDVLNEILGDMDE